MQAELIEVDLELCCGYADCVVVAPEVFDIGDDGLAYALPGAEVAAETVQEAVDICPMAAIRVKAS